MDLFGTSSFKLRLVLLGVFALLLLYLIASVTSAQDSAPSDAETAAAERYLRYLPTVIKTHTSNVLPLPPKTPTAGSTTESATMVANRNTVGSTIDTTEDYKALGYTDNRKIVRDNDGNLYVAYRKKWNGQYRIFIAKSTDQGKRWAVLNGKKPVETSGDYTQRVPSLAIGRDANDEADFLHLVWYGNDSEHTGNERQIKYLRLTTEGGLAADDCCTAIFAVAGYAGQTLWQEHPAIYVNGSNVYIVWEGRDATSSKAKIKVVRSTDFGRTWTEPLDVAPSDQINFSRPTLAVTYNVKERQLYVMAYGESNGLAQIYWTRSFDNGDSWESWQTVAPAQSDQRHVSLARDDAGNLHVVWREVTPDKDGTILRYRVFDPTLVKGAGDWSAAAETIAAQPGLCLFFPSVAVDENSQIWVAWTESRDCHTLPNDDPTTGQIVYRIKSAAGKWGNPTRLTTGGAQLYASLRSAHAPSGTTTDIVWLDVSRCAGQDQGMAQKGKNEEAASPPATGCVIHYTTLKE